MYQLSHICRMYRNNPWNRPYEHRIETLKNAKRMDRNTVAFIYPGFDSSTFRYRGYNISETLEYSMWWAGAYFQMEDLPLLREDLHAVDVVVMIRCAWDDELEDFMSLARSRGVRLCYDVDDLVCHPKYMPQMIEALGLDKGTEWNFWFGLTARHSMILNACDFMIVTNEYLAGHLKNDFGKPCYVIKNYLNWIQEDVSQQYFEEKILLDAQKPFLIGYFSGSPTHKKDLMTAMPELEEFLMAHENAVLQIVGFMELPEAYNGLVDRGKIRFVSFQTVTGLQYEQAKADVNIVPLVNNEFSNCKSELKYFESAVVGTITCATPSYAYAHAIEHTENGYLCRPGEWLPTLEKLYESGVSVKQQQYIRQKALEEYSGRKQIGLVEGVFSQILKA